MDEIRPGADEGRILSAMQGAIFEGGGDYPGNEFIIGSGHDALLCRYKSGRRVLDERDQITLEWAGSYRHYHAAAMRTIVVGTPSDRHQEMYLATREALAAVETQMVSGKTFGDIFDAHAERMDAHGMMAAPAERLRLFSRGPLYAKLDGHTDGLTDPTRPRSNPTW